jgi:hypothetical protein
MQSLVELFVHIDDFCPAFLPELEKHLLDFSGCMSQSTDRILIQKRAIVETVIDQLKNISQIEHSRHRSVANFMVNLLCGLIAYAHQPWKIHAGWRGAPVTGRWGWLRV